MDIKSLTGNNRTEVSPSIAKARVTEAAARPAAASVNNVSSESVTLTQTARTMSAIRDNAGNVPFDGNRVAEIKAALAEGRYPIDNQRLAQRMLDFEDLLTHKSSYK